jgi:hypothetical protein
MAQDFRNVLVRTIGTSDTTLLAGGNYDAVIGIRCCNILTSTIANGVLAGPITIPGTITVTGVLVIV